MILVFAKCCGPWVFFTEIRLFFPPSCRVVDCNVRIVFDYIVTETQFVSLSTQDLVPLFK